MATQQATIDFLLDQTASAGEMHARKMFGEYALYCEEKVVALVCDNQLFVKITEQGKEFVGSGYQEGFAYPGAKPSMHINEEMFDDHKWLGKLIRTTADALSAPKPKKQRPREH